MASTYTPNDAFTFAQIMVKRMPLDDVKIAILNDAATMFWMAAPWRWTLGSFPIVNLIANTQDYAITLPADFLYLQDAAVTDGVGDVPRPLTIVPLIIPLATVPGQTSEVYVFGTPGGAGTVRIQPVYTTIKSLTTLKVYATYKKTCTKITTGNTANAILVFDDEWFWVFKHCVLYYSYLYADDQRAGSAVVSSSGQVQYTGQLAVAQAAIEQMRQQEKLRPFDGRMVQEPKEK